MLGAKTLWLTRFLIDVRATRSNRASTITTEKARARMTLQLLKITQPLLDMRSMALGSTAITAKVASCSQALIWMNVMGTSAQ